MTQGRCEVSFAIVADLPLGTFRGAGTDGRPERIPSVSRLHSALLCAAGFGPRAVVRAHDSLDLDEADVAALRWLENNPPDSVRIPALEANTVNAIAYRDDGTWGGFTIRKLPKAPDDGTAVNGQFMWIWSQTPPEPVRTALEELCPDVPYLGTTESPVRLTAVTGDAFDATHDLDTDAGLFTTGGTGLERPVSGRLEELSDAHRAANGAPPRVAQDAYRKNEASQSSVPPRRAVDTAWYLPRQNVVGHVPWTQVIVIPISAPVPEEDRVRYAVAVHRALVKLLGFGAPAMITGAYLPGTLRPANRIALHLLAPGALAEERRPCLAILIPASADAADLDVLRHAVGSMTSLRGPRGKELKLAVDEIRVMDGSRFWSPPQPGTVRLWRTTPAAIPDTRGSRDAEWNFAHAALLSIGFVWKDHLPAKVSGRGPAYYRGLATAISEAGVAIMHARAIRTSDVDKYVHKVNEHAVVRPYTAFLSLGSLTGPGTIQAIGQSRHLGGGLLLPFDVPEGTRVADIRLPGEGGA
jgi:CRISPR-associated protein Csb2